VRVLQTGTPIQASSGFFEPLLQNGKYRQSYAKSVFRRLLESYQVKAVSPFIIAPATSATRDLSLRTCARPSDLKAQSLEFLQKHFGKSGSWYHAVARGEDDRPVEPNRPRKSSGSETTFAENRFLPKEIEAGVIDMADDVWAWCEKNQSFGSTVTVKIKYADFRIVTRSRTVGWELRLIW
jgi:hypothetical protein